MFFTSQNEPKGLIMLKYISLILMSIILSGCFERPVETERHRKVYEIIEIKRPKHFRVTLRDVETGRIFENKNISKHCNHWQKLKLNSRWYFDEVTYKRGDSYYMEIEGVKQLCELIKNQ